MRIRIFVTGGTFDKEYNELNGELFFKETHLYEMLKLGRCRLLLDIKTLMMIDSLEMTDSDRKMILENCIRADENKIVITHGTDTMVETAIALSRSFNDKVIVLTGAMEPAKFKTSDAMFNIGFAVAAVQVLKKGVYLAVSGRIFTPDNVRKNRAQKQFEEKM